MLYFILSCGIHKSDGEADISNGHKRDWPGVRDRHVPACQGRGWTRGRAGSRG